MTCCFTETDGCFGQCTFRMSDKTRLSQNVQLDVMSSCGSPESIMKSKTLWETQSEISTSKVLWIPRTHSVHRSLAFSHLPHPLLLPDAASHHHLQSPVMPVLRVRFHWHILSLLYFLNYFIFITLFFMTLLKLCVMHVEVRRFSPFTMWARSRGGGGGPFCTLLPCWSLALAQPPAPIQVEGHFPLSSATRAQQVTSLYTITQFMYLKSLLVRLLRTGSSGMP